ncbi:Kelch repeat-containing protein [Luteolibacter algae]|uniref:Kelch repeat-containing protein n=1 Tax=Luteolibacter algae TaxID=454151 RepID=A0ABW5DAK0_9BACT
MKRITFFLITVFACKSAISHARETTEEWRELALSTHPTARHEATFLSHEGKCYLLGGRRINPVDEFDPKTKTWRSMAKSPIELHHFQAISYDGKIWIVGALTGPYPGEKPVANIYIFDPRENEWSVGPEIPEGRRRGSNGVVLHEGKIYLVCGIRNGHIGGYVSWLDSYDPVRKEWKILPDAPRPRDHFGAALVDGKIIAAGGRTTSQETKQVFDLVIPEADIFDIKAQTWSTAIDPIPTPRAGTMTISLADRAVIAGGESMREKAHDEVEALDPASGKWESWPSLVTGRHGTGLAMVDGMLYTAAGCAVRGGGKEINSTEVLSMPVEKK